MNLRSFAYVSLLLFSFLVKVQLRSDLPWIIIFCTSGLFIAFFLNRVERLIGFRTSHVFSFLILLSLYVEESVVSHIRHFKNVAIVE